MQHAREAEAWQHFDANLDLLYRQRHGLRKPFLLPPRPRLHSEIEAAAWTLAQASEKNWLAGMIYSETLNDLDHCRHAVQIAEEQITAASARQNEAMEGVSKAMRQLRQVLDQGDVEKNRRDLERFIAQLPETYRNNLPALIEATTSQH